MTSRHNRLAAVALLSCAACQIYTPVSVTPAPHGQEVRITFAAAGATALQGNIGAHVTQLEGALQDANDSAIVVLVSHVTRTGGIEEVWDGEGVTLSRANITTVETRRTSVSRSLLAAGALVGGAILVSRAVGAGDQSGGSGKGRIVGQ
jgi:hypothetical protein